MRKKRKSLRPLPEIAREALAEVAGAGACTGCAAGRCDWCGELKIDCMEGGECCLGMLCKAEEPAPSPGGTVPEWALPCPKWAL